jgi:hypothetical protein
MKRSLLMFLILAALVLGCKKTKIIDEVTPVPTIELRNPSDFLRSLDVTGAAKVDYDSVLNSYMVSFPDSYDEERAEIKLALKTDVLLVDSLGKKSSDSVIYYRYKGTSPLNFHVMHKSDKYAFSYNVYFNFSGAPKIDLLQKEIPISSGMIKLPLDLKARVGSNPSSPLQYVPIVRVTNKRTGFSKESSLYGDLSVAFDSALYLITNDPLTLQIKYFNQTPITFEGIKFVRGLPAFRVFPDYKVTYSSKDSMHVYGGFFTPQAKYTATFTSDFLSKPMSVPIQVDDAENLSIHNLPNLSEGSYLVSFFEGDKLFGKTTVSISDTGSRCIETIWKGDIHRTLDRNTEALVLKRGDSFYVKPFPLAFRGIGAVGAVGDAKNLPVLRLKSSGRTVNLLPEVVVYNWAIAGVSYSLGKYLIPLDLPSDSYEIVGVYQNKVETKPYWSKLQIQ